MAGLKLLKIKNHLETSVYEKKKTGARIAFILTPVR